MSPNVPTLYDLVPGKVVDERYLVVQPNRQGGLSTAFEVVDQLDDEHYELQLFPSALFSDSDQAREFAHAWRPWSRVNSQAVAHVHDVLLLGDFTLMLLCALPIGIPLRQRLKDGPALGKAESLSIGHQLLAGLIEIHEHGLVHGDIKPSTIHIDGEGDAVRAMMVDGGATPGLWSAKDLGQQTALIGTPYYAPVEQFGGDSPDVQSDVYNVATVLFELLCGVLPWSGSTFLEVFQAKLDKNAPSMRARAPECSVGEDLERVIVKGLMAERSRRYATAREFLEQLESVMGN